MCAGDRLQQRALAGAVGSYQSVKRARLDRNVHAIQRAQCAKHLADACDLKKRHGVPREPFGDPVRHTIRYVHG